MDVKKCVLLFGVCPITPKLCCSAIIAFKGNADIAFLVRDGDHSMHKPTITTGYKMNFF